MKRPIRVAELLIGVFAIVALISFAQILNTTVLNKSDKNVATTLNPFLPTQTQTYFGNTYSGNTYTGNTYNSGNTYTGTTYIQKPTNKLVSTSTATISPKTRSTIASKQSILVMPKLTDKVNSLFAIHKQNFITSFTTTNQKNIGSPCYVYDPTNLNIWGATFDMKIQNYNSPEKNISLVTQNPPSILQTMFFPAINWLAPCVVYFNPYLFADPFYVGTELFIVSNGLIQGPSFKLSDQNSTALDPAAYFRSDLYDYDSYQNTVDKERAVTAYVDKNKKIDIRLQHPPGNEVQFTDISAPATNCAKLAGNDGPQKVVFMMGDVLNFASYIFLYESTAIRDKFLTTDPFKKYKDKFSFYVDLSNKYQRAALSAQDASVAKSQSSCGGDGFLYVYLYNADATSVKKGNFSFPGGGVAFIDYQTYAKTDRELSAVIHEIGHALGKLNDEYKNPATNNPGNIGDIPTKTNCALDPFTSYRDLTTNHIYGAPDKTRCFYDKDPSGNKYYRPDDGGLMDDDFSLAPTATSIGKFNVISCGYLVSAIKGEPLTKDNALKYWPECKNMDTVKNGIPPELPAPVISDIEVVPLYPIEPRIGIDGRGYFPGEGNAVGKLVFSAGSKIKIQGTGFTPTGNSIKFTAINNDFDFTSTNEIYEINNIASLDSKTLIFNIPQDISVQRQITPPFHLGLYKIKAGALNSDWTNLIFKREEFGSNEVVIIHATAPTDLVATTPKKGQIKFSWSNNGNGESIYFDLEKFVDNYNEFIPAKRFITGSSYLYENLPDSLTRKYRLRANYSSEGGYSDYTNTVTVTTLPKPKSPTLLAESMSTPDDSIMLKWVDNETDIKSYDILEEPSGDVVNNTTSRNILIDGLDPATEYCYSVVSVVNENNKSDKSNIACATTGEPTLELFPSLGQSQLDNVIGTVSFNLNTDLDSVSSISLVADNGITVDTDQTAPWTLNFNSTAFPNGPHNIYAVVNTQLSGGIRSFQTPPTHIVVNNPPPVSVMPGSCLGTPKNAFLYQPILWTAYPPVTDSRALNATWSGSVNGFSTGVTVANPGKIYVPAGYSTVGIKTASVVFSYLNAFSTPATCSINVIDPVTLIKAYKLIITNNGNGTITGTTIIPGTTNFSVTAINCGNICSVTPVSGTIINLTAKPNSGSFFTGWETYLSDSLGKPVGTPLIGTGNCSGSNPVCSVTVDRPKFIKANFGVLK